MIGDGSTATLESNVLRSYHALHLRTRTKMEDQPNRELRCSQVAEQLTRRRWIWHQAGLCLDDDRLLRHEIGFVSADHHTTVTYLVANVLGDADSAMLEFDGKGSTVHGLRVPEPKRPTHVEEAGNNPSC